MGAKRDRPGATVCVEVKRHQDIRDVEVEVVARAAEAKDASDARGPRDPPPGSVSARRPEPSSTNDDVRAMIDDRRLEERPPWPAPVPVREPSPGTDAAETFCEIKLWRGYFKGAFYARLLSDNDPLSAVARSPYFRHRGPRMPDEAGEALSAYEVLVRELERNGWEHARSGNAWFADILVRHS